MSENRCRQCGILIEEAGLCASCELLKALPDKLASRKELGGIPFQDMKQVDEAERIRILADHLRAHPGMTCHLMVDLLPGYEDKADRYIRLVTAALPGVEVMGRRKGWPIKECETVYLAYFPKGCQKCKR